jgi:hypothetical protein
VALLGKAAMLLSFDIAEDAIAEHDEWHTHEHLPERLSIPGFLRGTRWTAVQGQPRYFVMYEVERLETLASEPYLTRLNNPTPRTAKVMPHYRGMTRGVCSIVGSWGVGLGHAGLLVRFKAAPGKEAALADRLGKEVLPSLPERRGLGSVHLFKGAPAPQMTQEQRIRGADAGVDWALLATGYDEGTLQALARDDLGDASLEKHGAATVSPALYRTDYTLTARDLAA